MTLRGWLAAGALLGIVGCAAPPVSRTIPSETRSDTPPPSPPPPPILIDGPREAAPPAPLDTARPIAGVEVRTEMELVVVTEVLKNGLRHGFEHAYYPDGSVARRTRHANGLEEGQRIYWDRDGSLAGVTSFKGGLEEGPTWQLHNGTGEPIVLAGPVVVSGANRAGRRHGTFVCRDRQGTTLRGRYQGGSREGTWEFWRGGTSWTANYRANGPVGVWREVRLGEEVVATYAEDGDLLGTFPRAHLPWRGRYSASVGAELLSRSRGEVAGLSFHFGWRYGRALEGQSESFRGFTRTLGVGLGLQQVESTAPTRVSGFGRDQPHASALHGRRCIATERRWTSRL